MLTAVILAGEGDEERLVRTLAALMPAVLEGLVRDAVVVGSGATLAQVADQAGCAPARDLDGGLRLGRGEWLLVLAAGVRPSEGWERVVREHLARSQRPARFRASGGLLSRFRRSGAFREGLLLRREEALARGAGALPRLRPARLGVRIDGSD